MEPVVSNTRQKVSGVYPISTTPPLLPASVTPLSRLKVQDEQRRVWPPQVGPSIAQGRKP